MLNYESITVQVTSAGTVCTISYETSDDSLVWVACGGLTASNTGFGLLLATSSTTGMSQFARKGLYFRARVSTYGSGTVTVIGTLSKVSVQQPSLTYIVGTTVENGVVPSNFLSIGLEGRTSSKASVTNATSVRPIATVGGRQIVRLDAIPERLTDQ